MTRRVAIVSDAAGYVGPFLARLLAQKGHDKMSTLRETNTFSFSTPDSAV